MSFGIASRAFRVGDERGTVAVLTALLAPALVGGLAIVVDGAWWRYRTAVLQTAADGVAMSAALDIGNGQRNAALLQAAALNESRKFGCAASCTVSVSYPFNGNSNAVQVTVTDTNAQRFFSALYDSTQRQLRGRAVAQVFSSGGSGGGSGGGTGTGGSACILALGVGQQGSGIFLQNRQVVVESGCEMFANSTGSAAVTVENGPQVNSRVSARGQIVVRNMNGFGGVPNQNPNVANPITDPYATQVNQSYLRFSNFPNGGGAPFQSNGCIERLSDPNNPVGVNWSGNQAANLTNAATRGYSFNAATNSHFLGGGGGRFCSNFNLPAGVTLNLGPGIWYFSGDVTVSGTINATDRALDASGNPTQVISTAGVPNMPANTPIDGATLVWGRQNVNIVNAWINVVAPRVGPTAGIAMMQFQDDTAQRNWEVANGSNFQWQGAVYMPTLEFRVQSSSGLIQSITPPGATNGALSGCSQIVARAVSLMNDVSLGNLCANLGVQPFGTTSGWFNGSNIAPGSGGGSAGSGGSGGTGIRARLTTG